MRVKFLFLFLLLIAFTVSQALAVSVTVSNGMVVQTYIGTPTPSDTASMGRIVLDGDVTDFITSTETGKILGKVTCSNMAKTSFAGITLTNITGTKNGTITRITGEPEATYQCTLNSAPDNMPVYYIVRQNGADLTADVSFAFEDDGSVDPPYSIKRFFSATPGWEDYGSGTAASPILATAVPFHFSAAGGANNVVIGVHYNIALATIYAKLMLEGPYNTNTQKMNLVPKYKDYFYAQTTDPFGIGMDITVPPQVTNLVDFVLVCLRSTEDGLSIDEQVGFVTTDGYLYDLLGNPGIQMNEPEDQSYYIVIFQRNHLPIQSANAILLSTLTGYGDGQNYYDFTILANCYKKRSGSNNDPVKHMGNNIYAMWAGNAGSRYGWEADADSSLRMPKILFSNDDPEIRNHDIEEGYLFGDTNLDGVVVWSLDVRYCQLGEEEGWNALIATEVPMPVRN